MKCKRGWAAMTDWQQGCMAPGLEYQAHCFLTTFLQDQDVEQPRDGAGDTPLEDAGEAK